MIAGNNGALTQAIEAETARRAGQYALALIPDREARPETAANAARIPLDWNPGSPISARTLILAVENRLGHVDEAILVCDPPLARRAEKAGISLAGIEALVNDQIKGWLFLVRELALAFRARGEGTLALVYPEPGAAKDDAGDIAGQAAFAVFRSLVSSLLASAAGEPYFVQGFSGGDAGDEAGFAAFIAKQLEDGGRRGSGKLHKYGKLGIFK